MVCRDAVTRVWEWLDVSVSREASLQLGAADFGHMHLSEGSSATTAVTAALDAPPCDTVEPCVSSLPDGQARRRINPSVHVSCKRAVLPLRNRRDGLEIPVACRCILESEHSGRAAHRER